MYGIAICVEAVYICLICLACKNRVTVRSKWSRMDKKVLILEDDFSNADIIKQLIQEYDKCIKVYIESNVNNAYALVMENRIHLFVIDIILDTSCQGDTSGIKFAESVRSIAKYKYTPMVFITALKDPEIYAFRELHCYGYLEKPFFMDQAQKLLIDALEFNHADCSDTVLHFRKDGILYPIPCRDIVYAQSIDHSMCFYLRNKTTFSVYYKTCRQILEEVEYDGLIQCNRGTIVNRGYIKNVDVSNGMITLEGDVKVEMGRRYKKKFLETLKW